MLLLRQPPAVACCRPVLPQQQQHRRRVARPPPAFRASSGVNACPRGGRAHQPGGARPRRPVVRPAAAAADAGAPLDALGPAFIGLRARLRSALAPSPLDAELVQLAVPALASMLLEPLMNMVAAAVLGHLGTQQLGAVSLASLATSLATYVFSFLLFLTTPRIAAAHAHGDAARVSRLAAVGLWLAAATGVVLGAGMHAGAGFIVQALNPREPEVAVYAVDYIRARSWGIVAALLGFVASGTYRGVKDTATPLQAALGAAAANLVLTPLFILGLGWGVAGAGLAVTLSTWVSCALLVGLLLRRRLLWPQHLAVAPRRSEMLPYLWKGSVLAFRMVVTFGMIMFASAVCVRAGAASQAAFEIIRQLWILSVQLFEALNVATQAMAAAFLGRSDRASAREVLVRALQLSSVLGVGMGLLLAVAQAPLVRLFTNDAVVAGLACGIIPIIALFMPLDAAASITDGGLIAAGQTNALSVMQVLGTLVQWAALALLVALGGTVDVTSVWGVLKLLTLARLGGGLWIHFVSRRSAYRPREQPQAQQALQQALPPPQEPQQQALPQQELPQQALQQQALQQQALQQQPLQQQELQQQPLQQQALQQQPLQQQALQQQPLQQQEPQQQPAQPLQQPHEQLEQQLPAQLAAHHHQHQQPALAEPPPQLAATAWSNDSTTDGSGTGSPAGVDSSLLHAQAPGRSGEQLAPPPQLQPAPAAR